MVAIDMIIKEIGWDTDNEEPKSYIDGLTAGEIITRILGTRQMKLPDYS